jgi:hypothetical protein
MIVVAKAEFAQSYMVQARISRLWFKSLVASLAGGFSMEYVLELR